MKIRPLQDRLLVRRVEEETKTKGGLIIPDTAKEKPVEGEVIAVGTGKVLDSGKQLPPEVKVGDRILFGKYAGSEIKVEGVEHIILREDEVLGIVSKYHVRQRHLSTSSPHQSSAECTRSPTRSGALGPAVVTSSSRIVGRPTSPRTRHRRNEIEPRTASRKGAQWKSRFQDLRWPGDGTTPHRAGRRSSAGDQDLRRRSQPDGPQAGSTPL